MTFFGCSSDDESIKVKPDAITFVYADGTEIVEKECINPSTKYAVKIEINSKGIKKNEPLRVDYSVNGVVYTMTFSSIGSQINPIKLVEGNNVGQIIGTDYKCNLNYIAQGDFELVK